MHRMKNITAALAAIVILASLTGAAASQEPTLARVGIIHGSGHFESSDRTGFRSQGGTDPEIDTNTVRSGTHSVKCFCDAEVAVRSELSLCPNDTDPYDTPNSLTMIIGEKYWIGFSVFTAADWIPQDAGRGLDDIILNIQAIPDAGEAWRSPVLAISQQTNAGPGNQWKVRSRWDYGDYSGWGFDGSRATYVDFNNVIGYWTDFVIEVEWNATDNEDGMIKVWINGVLEVDWTGSNCSNDDIGPQIQFGAYIWYFSGEYDESINQFTRTYYCDELRLGDHTSSYNDVAPATPTTEPLLVNGGFEGGWHRETAYWTPTGGPYHNQFSEIAPPEGWTAWWRERFPCSGTDDWETERPEVRVITAVPDPERIHGGERAAQFFTFWRCHDGGLLQQVDVEQGHYYQFSVYAHAWYSRCSTKPHGPPYDTDCQTRIYWAQDYLSIGIDPTGGLDPMASTVEWGPGREVYGRYGGPLITWRVQALSDKITVIVRSEASHPLKHVDLYIDDAVLRDVTYQAFLPFVRR